MDPVESAVPHVRIYDIVLHKKLVTRLALLGIVAIFLGATILFDAARYGFSILSAFPIFTLGVVLGVTIFSRIAGVVWDEGAAAVSVGKMDVVGFVTLVLYYVFDIVLRSVLLHVYAGSDLYVIRGLLVAGVFGAVVGRLLWFVVAIRRAHRLA